MDWSSDHDDVNKHLLIGLKKEEPFQKYLSMHKREKNHKVSFEKNWSISSKFNGPFLWQKWQVFVVHSSLEISVYIAGRLDFIL